MTKKKVKILPADKFGWPIERIKGHPISYIIRCLLHAKGFVIWDRERGQPIEKTMEELEGIRIRHDEGCDTMYFRRQT